ncbi:MAG: T9SS type A sorting domain-containing protein, partial [Chitinophagaceae bacterium]|nr:T9SS type A sorting domain-containing protein [Chitinophagaceae bacterium]
SNIGANALTNVALTANVYNSLNVLVHSATATSVASIAVGANAAFTMPDFTPTIADVYTIKYNHVQTEVDPVTANDELTRTMEFTNNVFARDNGTVVGGLGIGAGNGGYIGQSFTLTNPAYLYSITAFYNKGYLANERYASAIWNTNVGGVPTTILATTDTMTYPNQSSILTTTPIFGGNILLPAGTYVVTAIEFDSTVQLGTTDEIFTVGKHWVNWPTTPLGGWGNIESFGATFMKALAIRMNIGATAFPLPSEALILKGKSSELHHELSWSNLEKASNKYEYVLQRSDDAKTWSDVYETSSIGQDKISSFTTIDTKSIRPKSYYRVRVKNQDNELKYSNMITLLNNSKELLVDIYPNPTNGVLNLNLNNFKNTTMSLYDIQGKVVLTKQLTEANNTISLQGISAGVYQIKLANSNTIIYQDKIIIQ